MRTPDLPVTHLILTGTGLAAITYINQEPNAHHLPLWKAQQPSGLDGRGPCSGKRTASALVTRRTLMSTNRINLSCRTLLVQEDDRTILWNRRIGRLLRTQAQMSSRDSRRSTRLLLTDSLAGRPGRMRILM